MGVSPRASGDTVAWSNICCRIVFFFQAEDGIRDLTVTGVQTCALPISFGEERLERVDNTTSLRKLAEWKDSEKLIKAYEELFSNHDLLSKIGHNVFKIGRASCRERV